MEVFDHVPQIPTFFINPKAVNKVKLEIEILRVGFVYRGMVVKEKSV